MADMSLSIEMRNQYLTIRGKRDGLGAQLLAQVSGLAYCEYHSLTYVHSPFEKVAHGLTAATVSAAEAFFGIGVGEPNIGDSSVASLNIEERLFMPEVLFSSKPETFYTDSFRQREVPEGQYLRDTHKPEAILLSLTPLVFERFLPSLTLWLSPNCLTI